MHVEDIASQSSVVFKARYTANRKNNFWGSCLCFPR